MKKLRLLFAICTVLLIGAVLSQSGFVRAAPTTAGTITQHLIPTIFAYPTGITLGPDGNLWFTESNGNKIGRLSPRGGFKEYPLPAPNSMPIGITTGPDGNLWFTERYGDQIGRITTTGQITEFHVSQKTGGRPIDIARGPTSALWFTEFARKIGEITTE